MNCTVLLWICVRTGISASHWWAEQGRLLSAFQHKELPQHILGSSAKKSVQCQRLKMVLCIFSYVLYWHFRSAGKTLFLRTLQLLHHGHFMLIIIWCNIKIWLCYITGDLEMRIRHKTNVVFMRSPLKKTNIILNMTKNIKPLSTFIVYHRAGMKKDHYTAHLLSYSNTVLWCSCCKNPSLCSKTKIWPANLLKNLTFYVPC